MQFAWRGWASPGATGSLARVLCVAAPTGPNEIAQGDALGNRGRKVAALKGLNGQTGSAPGVQGLAQEVGRFLRKRRGRVRPARRSEPYRGSAEVECGRLGDPALPDGRPPAEGSVPNGS
jgi:hypothetical protein